MANTKKTKSIPKKEEPATVAIPEPNHTEKITSQVLAKTGTPPRLQRVEVSNHHNGKYRVNLWEQPELKTSFAVTVSARIGRSYYLTVSETGEIINSNPPMTRIDYSA